ncbi:MAG: hypothetical protein KC729_10715, partial [Candidatus Eisenbacteria bacterium]|nr:hypothetical protein [Candidatus Eisenbacteria bacterium]
MLHNNRLAGRLLGASRLWWILVGVIAFRVWPAQAQDPEWSLSRPSNSGIPGEEIRGIRWSPSGEIWVVARWPFWEEGGIGISALPSAATSLDVWDVLTNFETPIPSEYINDVEWDGEGNVWIATDRGLVRYDGMNWTVWDPTNSPMALYRVRGISVAPDGHIWINNSDSNGGGDALWDFDGSGGWTSHAVPTELPWPAPWSDLASVAVTGDGHVWTSNQTLAGLAEWDGATWTLHGGDVSTFAGLTHDSADNIWCIGNPVGGDDAFFKWDGSSFTRFPFAEPTTIAVDPEDGNVYVGNWFGEVRRSTNGGSSFTSWLSGLNRVVSLAPQPGTSDVWVGTAGAVGHFRQDGTLVDDYNSYNTGMPWFWVDRMMTDRDGYFWMATGEAGLSRFDGQRWRNWGEHNAGSEPYPFAGNEPMGVSFEDHTGVHWFGGNGIARWDSQTGTFTGFWNWQNNPGMGVTLFTYIAEDAAGNLFASTEYGTVFRFDPGQQLWINDHFIYAAAGLPGMESDSQGNVWLAGWFALHEWDGNVWEEIALPDPNYFFDLGGISCLAIGPDDVFWFGTPEGLVRWDGVTFDHFDMSNTPLPAQSVVGVDVREDGLIGIAAADNNPQSGIALLDGDPLDPGSWR